MILSNTFWPTGTQIRTSFVGRQIYTMVLRSPERLRLFTSRGPEDSYLLSTSHILLTRGRPFSKSRLGNCESPTGLSRASMARQCGRRLRQAHWTPLA